MIEVSDKDAVSHRVIGSPRGSLLIAVACAAIVSSVGCSAPPESTDGRAIHPDKPLARVEASALETASATRGEVPVAVMERVRTQLALDSAAADTAQLARSEQVTFNDGSLGCPEPGSFYTMATVPGYHVVFDVAGETFDYRVTMQGTVKRCVGRSNPPESTTPPAQ